MYSCREGVAHEYIRHVQRQETTRLATPAGGRCNNATKLTPKQLSTKDGKANKKFFVPLHVDIFILYNTFSFSPSTFFSHVALLEYPLVQLPLKRINTSL